MQKQNWKPNHSSCSKLHLASFVCSGLNLELLLVFSQLFTTADVVTAQRSPVSDSHSPNEVYSESFCLFFSFVPPGGGGTPAQRCTPTFQRSPHHLLARTHLLIQQTKHKNVCVWLEKSPLVQIELHEDTCPVLHH